MAPIADSLRVLASWPAVGQACDEAREACTRLRFHEALRRRIPEAAAESRVRGAHASAELEGARSDVAHVRDLMRGAAAWPDELSPVLATMRGAVQATAEAEHLAADLARSPRRALARLHLAAATPLSPAEQVGRPRRAGEACGEFTELGPAPDDPGLRLTGVVEALAATDVPAVVVAAVVHAEVALARPFVRGNGLVARALARCVVLGRGLDTTGVAVPEIGHHRAGQTAYLGSLSAYATGDRAGVELWIAHCGAALVAGAVEGERVADAVRAGRLGPAR